MYSDDENELFSIEAGIPLLPQQRQDKPNLNNNYRYGSPSSSWTKKTGVKLMQKSPLTNNAKASIVVPTSHTVYKNGKPKYENYKIKIVNNNKMFFHPLTEGVWRSFKEFCWLRKYFLKQYHNQIIPPLPPSYFFRRNYERGIVNERKKGLQEFLQRCVELKHLVADELFHLFVQSDLSVTEMRKQQEAAHNKLSLFHCFTACSNQTTKESKEGDNNNDDDDEIDYSEFKKELECVLKESKSKQINLYQH